MPLLEDYSATARDLQQAIDNLQSVIPTRRRFEWRYGLVDSAPPDARSCFPARLPRPPREPIGVDSHPADHSRGRRATMGAPRAEHGARAVGGDGEGRSRRGVSARQDPHDKDDRTRRRPARQPCDDRPFVWPSRRGDDDDDDNGDYDHPGQGRKLGDDYWGCAGVARRDRTRSPPRRNYAPPHERRHEAGDPRLNNLAPSQLQALFVVQATTLKNCVQQQVIEAPDTTDISTLDARKRFWHTDADEYIRKACWLADRLGIEDAVQGEKAWSDPVPLPRVFNTLRAALLPAPSTASLTIQDVDRALDILCIEAEEEDTSDMGQEHEQAAAQRATAHVAEPEPQQAVSAGATVGLRSKVRGQLPAGPWQAQQTKAIAAPPAGAATEMARETPQAGLNTPSPGTKSAKPTSGAHYSPQPLDEAYYLPLDTHPVRPADWISNPEQHTPMHQSPDARPQICPAVPAPQIDDLFATPPPPALLQPPPQRTRRGRTFDMSKVRRSARLAKKPVMPAVERVQRNL